MPIYGLPINLRYIYKRVPALMAIQLGTLNGGGRDLEWQVPCPTTLSFEFPKYRNTKKPKYKSFLVTCYIKSISFKFPKK